MQVHLDYAPTVLSLGQFIAAGWRKINHIEQDPVEANTSRRGRVADGSRTGTTPPSPACREQDDREEPHP